MKKILIINANYYKEISNNLLKAAKKKFYYDKLKIDVVSAPGILEIPYLIRKYIKKYDGFIALGCVIKGETPHFDYISKTTFQNIMYLSLTFNKPITNGIITALNKKQALIRSSLNNKNRVNKGAEAAAALVDIMNSNPYNG